MSPVSAVLDRLRSATRRPSAPPRDPGAAASLATLLAASAADADHWHAGDTRVVLPAQRRSVDLRALELEAGGPRVGALQVAALRQAELVTADAGPPLPAPPVRAARAAQAWQARPGPTTWFG